MHVDMLKVGEHYVLIRSLSRLCTKQLNNHDGARFICRRCLHFCTSERVLADHMERCVMHKAQTVKMTEATDENPENQIRCTKIEKQLPLPFLFVADFESILAPIDTALPEVPEPDQPVRDENGKFRLSEYRNGDPEQGLRAGSSTTRI